MNYAGNNLSGRAIRKALGGLGRELGDGHPIEFVIVGGAAGLLAHLLPGTVTTSDVDAINFRPSGDLEVVLRAAVAVAGQQGISKGWLNTEAGLFANAIPTDWETRRSDVGKFGRLHVLVIGRLDLIAMKFYAHREIDFDHLERLKITPEELSFSKNHLMTLIEKLPDEKSRIEMAIHVVENWSVTS